MAGTGGVGRIMAECGGRNEKQPAQPVSLAEPLIPTVAPSPLPWERARERAASRKACTNTPRQQK